MTSAPDPQLEAYVAAAETAIADLLDTLAST